jgi:aldose 1-epimerase
MREPIGLALLAAVAAAVTVAAPSRKAEAAPKMKTPTTPKIQKLPFGKISNGEEMHLYVLQNRKGMKVSITNFGARVVSIVVPDRNGKFADVALGYDNAREYQQSTTYFGAIVGRYANRIANGRFTLDGVTYHLPINDGPNSLHGGKIGFDKLAWHAKILKDSRNPVLELTLVSPNGDQGYPGTLRVRVIYTLLPDNALRIEYHATTNKPTIINLTNHTYFNLDGAGNKTILPTVLMINADKYTPTDDTQIPTGKVVSVKGTPFNFLKPTAVGERIDEDNQQLKFAHGYDDNWVLNRDRKKGLALAARAYDPRSGRVLTVYATQPGLQFYTGNYLHDVQGSDGAIYHYRSAFTLETQHYPDSPNHPNFPSTVLNPGQVYRETTVFKFSVER